MKVALVGDQRPALEVALEAEDGVELVGAPEALGGEGEIPQLAAALRAFESLFEREQVERVVVAGSSNIGLAAVLVATKMLIPAGAVVGPRDGGREDGRSDINARLIEQLADAALGDDAGVVAAWVREPQEPSQATAEH